MPRLKLPSEKFEQGDQVEVISGSMTGLTGELIKLEEETG